MMFTILCALVLHGIQGGNGDICASSALSYSSNAFASALLKEIGGRGNLIISPASVFAALGMTYLGAGGGTASQLETSLFLSSRGLEGRNLHHSIRELLRQYDGSNDEYRLLMANGVFLQEGYPVNQSYIADVEYYYNGKAKNVDFVSNGEAAKNEINEWVADKTQNKIEEFLEEDPDPSTRAILLNAVYFKGEWETELPNMYTESGTFYKNDGSTKRVMYMGHPKPYFPFFHDEELSYKFLEMPYKGEDIGMLLALPDSRSEFPELDMDSSLLCKIYSNFQTRAMDVFTIPKFRLEFGKELSNTLQELGIRNLFDSHTADLSGITPTSGYGRNLYISSVMHEAVINVNEKGTEAAAVTAVVAVEMSLLYNAPRFEADHPFLFYIVDKKNNIVLFAGRLVDP